MTLKPYLTSWLLTKLTDFKDKLINSLPIYTVFASVVLALKHYRHWHSLCFCHGFRFNLTMQDLSAQHNSDNIAGVKILSTKADKTLMRYMFDRTMLIGSRLRIFRLSGITPLLFCFMFSMTGSMGVAHGAPSEIAEKDICSRWLRGLINRVLGRTSPEQVKLKKQAFAKLVAKNFETENPPKSDELLWAAREYLDASEISYEQKNIEWKKKSFNCLKLLPGSSVFQLSKISGGMQRRYNTQMVYCPEMLADDTMAQYLRGEKAVILSHQALLKNTSDESTLHEIHHAYLFERVLSGKPHFLSADVFVRSSSLIPNYKGEYTTGFSFEEVSTYALSAINHANKLKSEELTGRQLSNTLAILDAEISEGNELTKAAISVLAQLKKLKLLPAFSQGEVAGKKFVQAKYLFPDGSSIFVTLSRPEDLALYEEVDGSLAVRSRLEQSTQALRERSAKQLEVSRAALEQVKPLYSQAATAVKKAKETKSKEVIGVATQRVHSLREKIRELLNRP